MKIKIPLRLQDWTKIKKTGRGYTRRELTVVQLLRELSRTEKINSFLNIGFHDYQDIRTRWWIDICRANSIDWKILEIFETNVVRFKEQAPAADHHRIVTGCVSRISEIFDQHFDVVLHWHGPEHLERDMFLHALPGLINRTGKLLILGCPDGHEEQGEAYNNPYEKHLSFWTIEDFASLGFQTQQVKDKKPGHITAFKFINSA